MILARFKWYRRARGGYWAQVTAHIGLFAKTRWIRCEETQPTPDQQWEFYPWAAKTMGNGYVDEWHSIEPCYTMAFSLWMAETLGTNDVCCILGLIQEARAMLKEIENEFHYHNLSSSQKSELANNLRIALAPFAEAKTIKKAV